ncbi:MAG TPA: phosphate/phosphite/phosphonate ABC transporter substrate-binding protein [Bdellovibrionota bacterium]|nr:phosphate/phosphite/phosphonate ABC transporter substrate-binding protein [Bdellovibrionota bacterium]
MKRTLLWSVCLIALLTISSGCTKKEKPNEQQVFTMGFNPPENAEVVQTNADALAKVLEEKTGYKFKTFIATDYTALVEALRSHRVDFAWLAPFSYVQAEKLADAEVLLKAVRHGTPYYFSAIIVRADSPYKTVEDLKGQTIAWVDPSSSSGHIFPKAALMEKGINPDTFFSKQIFAGSHDALLLSILNGTTTAGATFSNDEKGDTGAWTQLLKGDDTKKIRPIFVTKPIPGDTLSTSKYFREHNPEVVKKVTETLVSFKDDPKGQELLKNLYRIDYLTEATSQDYEPVRAAARLLQVAVDK